MTLRAPLNAQGHLLWCHVKCGLDHNAFRRSLRSESAIFVPRTKNIFEFSHFQQLPLPRSRSLQAKLLAITALFLMSIFSIYSRNEQLSANNLTLKLKGIEKINQIAKISSY